MSIIEQALRKLELSRWNEQQVASEYLNPVQVVVPTGNRSLGLIWLAAGGLAVAVGFVSWPYIKSVGQSASLRFDADTPTQLLARELTPPAAAPMPMPMPMPMPAQGADVTPVRMPPSVALDWNAADWIRDGAAAMVKNDLTGAIRVWSTGLDQLPTAHPLVILPPSTSRAATLSLYRSLAGRYPAILVEEGRPGESLLGVVLVPERNELAELMTDLRTRLQRKALNATTVMDWRATRKGSKEKGVPLAAPGPMSVAPVKVVDDAAITLANAEKRTEKEKASSPVTAVTAVSAAEDLDPTRSVQGSAVSSADAILRQFTRVERLISQAQFEVALDAVNQVESDVGETWQTRYLKGTASQGLSRWDDAISALTRAHQLNPSSVKVLIARAICLQELGNHAAALDDLRLARALNPDMPEIALNAGYSLDALGRRNDAIREYKKYLEVTANRNEYAKVRAWVVKRVAG